MRLLIHVGGAKCGSSAIQGALAENVEHLAANGVLVPGVRLLADDRVTGSQIRFFLRMVNQDDGRAVVERRLRRLRGHMQKHGLHTLVLSAENLINPAPYATLLRVADDIFDEVSVVLYVRRQDDYLASAWQQWKLKTEPSLKAYLSSSVPRDANWSTMLGQWEEQFGRDRINVRRFQRSALVNGDVVDDFADVVGIPIHKRSKRAYNRSFNELLGDLGHRLPDLFEDQHDNQFFSDMRYAIGPKAFKDYSGSMLLTLEQRRDIMAAYQESNDLLRERYFPHLPGDEPLFEPPTEADVVTLSDDERRLGQQDLLVRAIVGLSRRVRKLEEENRTLRDQQP